ncbi:MAG TPA: 5'-3' exonuclease H3TH domain-containing protein [Patescibacteria group bacterium]|nr:5'-3' exonuclease H3TH domain-containing protein [Patescibacteria group bacterium]
MSETLVLIDGNSIVHRAFHAFPPLSTQNGILVNAVFGFSSMLLKIIDDLKPSYIAVAFDAKGPTFRHKAFPSYKAQRKKAPEELYAQIPLVKKVTNAFHIPFFELQGFEADDIIGTLTEQAERKGLKTTIVTGDLDALQLVSSKTSVSVATRGITQSVVYDEAKVYERFQLSPSQMVDYKALRGDPSDNIPGVLGIGEKTAAQLLKKYHTLDQVFQHTNDLPPTIKEKLENGKDQAYVAKNLVDIVRDVPVALDLSIDFSSAYKKEEAEDLLQRFGFTSLIKRLPGKRSIQKEGQLSLLKGAS